MAGGKIIRIVGGKNSIECDNWTVYTDEFNASAGGKSQFTADDGIHFGEPKEPELKKGVFVKGWWSSDKEGKNKITEAFLGDKVFFHIETKNIPNGEYIGTMLYDDDLKKIKEEKDNNKGSDKIALGPKGGNDYKYLRYMKVKNNKIVITILLGGILENLIEEEEDKQIELFFACSYNNENVELPLSFSDYLKVTRIILPLKVFQRAFAPWKKFGSIYGISPNSFLGDDRGFSLKDGAENGAVRAKDEGKVSARLHHNVEIIFPYEGIISFKNFASETEGKPLFIPKMNATAREKPYSEQNFKNNNLIMRMLGQDPLVVPAPNIDSKLDLNFKIVKDQLNITGMVYYKSFPAYEAFIEDNNGKRIFLHTFGPLHEELLAWELMDLQEIGMLPFNWADDLTGDRFKEWKLANPTYDYVQSIDIVIQLRVDRGFLVFDSIIKAKDVFRKEIHIKEIQQDKGSSRDILGNLLITNNFSDPSSIYFHVSEKGRKFRDSINGQTHRGLNKIKSEYIIEIRKNLSIEEWNHLHLIRPAAGDLDLQE